MRNHGWLARRTAHRKTKSARVSPAPPDGIDAGVVVSGAGRFEIPVGIDAAKCEAGGQHRGDGLRVSRQDHLLGREVEVSLRDENYGLAWARC